MDYESSLSYSTALMHGPSVLDLVGNLPSHHNLFETLTSYNKPSNTQLSFFHNNSHLPFNDYLSIGRSSLDPLGASMTSLPYPFPSKMQPPTFRGPPPTLKDLDEMEDIKPTIEQLKMLNNSVSLDLKGETRCHVCETPGATLHYGGMVCGGCKIFFARAVQKKSYYVCDRNGRCRMVAGKRSKCRSCRFQQCLKAKMCPEEVGKLRDLKTGGMQMTKEEGYCCPYFPDHLKQTLIKETSLLSISFKEQLRKQGSVMGVVQCFINMEQSCDNNRCRIMPSDCHYSLDLTIADALRNPLSISERTPLLLSEMKPTTDPSEQIKGLYCRLVMHYCEWLGGVEDMYMIGENERLSVVSSRWCAVFLLKTSFNTFKEKSSGFVLCNGLFYEKVKEPQDTCQLFLNVIHDGVHSKLINKMSDLNMSDAEFVLLKHILLFTLSEPLRSDEQASLVRSLRCKYECLLTQYVKETYPTFTNSQLIQRIADLLQLASLIGYLGECPNSAFAAMTAMNINGMRADLTFDMHLRSYQ